MGWHEREALNSGCDAYISKPISILGFLSTVETFLSQCSHEFSTEFAFPQRSASDVDGR
jgi:DNA-binding response OmpR family regulator